MSNEINSNQLDKLEYGNCRICQDKASGIHYGVATCEGCKGFYKRSVARKRLYFCVNKNKCKVNVKNRKTCKACRFKKCLDEGMSLQAIKLGRKSHYEKQTIVNSGEQANTDLVTSFKRFNIFPEEKLKGLQVLKMFCVENFKKQFRSYYKPFESSRIYDVFTNDAKNYEFFDLGVGLTSMNANKQMIPKTYFTERFINTEKENYLYFLNSLRLKVYRNYMDYISPLHKDTERAKYLIQNNIKVFNSEGLTKDEFMEAFLGSLADDIIRSISFLTNLPGFNQICGHDCNIMFKEYFYMMMIIRTNNVYFNGEIYLMLKNNVQLTKQWGLIILGEDASNYIMDVHEKLKNVNLSPQETSLIYPFMLTSIEIFYLYLKNEDVPLKNPEYISMLNKYYSSALMFEFSLNNRDMSFIDKVTEVLELLRPLKEYFNVPLSN